MSRKTTFLEVFAQEHERTMRVLRAYPPGKEDFKPHPDCRTAREIASVIVMGESLMVKALTTGFDWSKPQEKRPEPPAAMAGISDAAEKGYQRAVETVRGFDEGKLDETVQFPVGPKKMGDFKKNDFLWFLLHDQIHHRGQLSVYLRAAGGPVPAIYGPSGDEPWF